MLRSALAAAKTVIPVILKPTVIQQLTLQRNIMRVAGLISGGKDSCFNLMKCVAENHEVVALANLHPADPGVDELDSYMYQTTGHEMIEAISQALELPLHRRKLQGKSVNTGTDYAEPTPGDEVEDLYELIKEVKVAHDIQGVAVGAVLSDYQRVRVENVCSRLGLTCLGYLWSCDQMQLLHEMIDCDMQAVLVKVASIGLDPKKHLNKTIGELAPHLKELNSKYGVHVCGEGGEYETITLDCPLYNSTIIIDESEVITPQASDIAPVGYLKVSKYHLQPKPAEITALSWADRVKKIPIKNSKNTEEGIFSRVKQTDMVPYVRQGVTNASDNWPDVYKSYVYSTGNELFCSLQAQNTGNVAEDTERLMNNLKGILRENSFEFSNIAYALLYISDMSQFANINKVYTQFYGINPPPRICVEAALPKCSLFHAQVFCSKSEKATRHVQGVSHWAPSCIGPYSQTSKIGSKIYVSGQIPLVPGSMQCLPSGFAAQCHFAFDHAMTVAYTMEATSEHIIQAHCYVCNETDISYVFSEEMRARIPEKVRVMCILVPRLPRDVSVEWHINFDLEKSLIQPISASGSDLSSVCQKVAGGLSEGDRHYFTFYSAASVDPESLLEALHSCCPKHKFIPIPVAKVVTHAEQVSDAIQVTCVQVPGLP